MSPSRKLAAAGLAAVGLAAATAPAALAGDGPTRFSSCPEVELVATIDGYTFSMCFSTISNPNSGAHARFSGHLVEGSAIPTGTVMLTGFPCLAGYPTSFEPADFSRAVITKNGRVTGTCRT
jgi:hypothetical protein